MKGSRLLFRLTRIYKAFVTPQISFGGKLGSCRFGCEPRLSDTPLTLAQVLPIFPHIYLISAFSPLNH